MTFDSEISLFFLYILTHYENVWLGLGLNEHSEWVCSHIVVYFLVWCILVINIILEEI